MFWICYVWLYFLKGCEAGTVGPRIFSRQETEVSPGRSIIVPGIERTFSEDGKVTSFEYFSTAEAEIRFQVWRYKLYYQLEESHDLELVAQTEYFQTVASNEIQTHETFLEPLQVKQNDILGMEYLTKNPIPYDHNGNTCKKEAKTLHTDVKNSTIISETELISFKDLLSTRNPCRTYSFRAMVIYESEECQQQSALIGEEKILKSPGFDGKKNYEDNLEECWLLSAPNKHVVRMTLTVFALEDPGRGGTCFDYLRLIDGEFPGPDNTIKILCGKQHQGLQLYGITSRHMHVEFKSDVANRNKGFNLTYTAIASAISLPQQAPSPHPPARAGSDVPLDANLPVTSEAPGDQDNTTEETPRGDNGPGGGGDKDRNIGVIVGAVVGVSASVGVIVVIVVVVCCWKKGMFQKRRSSETRVADSGEAGLVTNEEKKVSGRHMPGRLPPGAVPSAPPRPMTAGARSQRGVPIHQEPQAVLPAYQEPQPVHQEPPLPEAEKPPQPHLPRSVTPIGPPSSHLPPLQHTAVPRPFTAANPRTKMDTGPIDHDPRPIDLDPDTTRERGTPLPPFEPEDNDQGQGHVGEMSYQNPLYQGDLQDEGQGQSQGHPYSPPPPYSEN